MSAAADDHEFAPIASIDALVQRAALLRRLRAFFDERGFIEVETPLLSPDVIPELHIEPIVAEGGAFLQASPELHMKRLLAAGATAIYQVTRSFRGGERGRLHNPEFTIVEWYRVGDDMRTGLDLLDQLLQSLLGTPPATRTTYAEAFQQQLGLNPHTATLDQLAVAASAVAGGWGRATASPQLVCRLGARQELDPSHPITPAFVPTDDRDAWLNLLLVTRVEPQLGRDRPEILYHYPASQSSLARVVRTSRSGHEVAERFEFYYRGIELANGFHELADGAELRRRLEAVNAARVADGRRALPLPERLLAAMEHGLPACTGCALGFDRLAMLAVGASTIDEVMAFPSVRAIIK
jgi:lysyl-tRNA synthetase class 2